MFLAKFFILQLISAVDVDHCTFLVRRRPSSSFLSDLRSTLVDVHFTALFITPLENSILFTHNEKIVCKSNLLRI